MEVLLQCWCLHWVTQLACNSTLSWSLQPPSHHWLISSQSYVTTDGQSASLSWCQAPIWGQDKILITVKTVVFLLMGGAFLVRGQVCYLQLLLALAIVVILSPSLAELMTIFYCLIFETPQTWWARNRVVQLYPQALDSFFCRLLWLAGLWYWLIWPKALIIALGGTTQKTSFPAATWLLCDVWAGNFSAMSPYIAKAVCNMSWFQWLLHQAWNKNLCTFFVLLTCCPHPFFKVQNRCAHID
jgi:hypothetical protein